MIWNHHKDFSGAIPNLPNLFFLSLNIDFSSFSLPLCATNWIPESKQAKYYSHFLLPPLPAKKKHKSCKSKCRAEELIAWGKGKAAGKAWFMPGSEKRGTFVWKNSGWLSFTGRRKRQAGNTDWAIFLVERPESLQPKWEPDSGGSPVPPTDLSVKCTRVTEGWTDILWKTFMSQGSRCFSLAVVHHKGNISPDSKSVSIKHTQAKAPVLLTATLNE